MVRVCDCRGEGLRKAYHPNELNKMTSKAARLRPSYANSGVQASRLHEVRIFHPSEPVISLAPTVSQYCTYTNQWNSILATSRRQKMAFGRKSFKCNKAQACPHSGLCSYAGRTPLAENVPAIITLSIPSLVSSVCAILV